MESNKYFLLGVVLFIAAVLINGCNLTEKVPAPNVIAILNGDEITIEDVKNEIEATEIGLKISAKMEGNTNKYLLRNSRMKIHNDDFKVVYYEEKWKLGHLDLKNY